MSIKICEYIETKSFFGTLYKIKSSASVSSITTTLNDYKINKNPSKYQLDNGFFVILRVWPPDPPDFNAAALKASM